MLATGCASREAASEYASVAAFGELALRLMAVGAPHELVAACHEAALDEVRHARTAEALAGRSDPTFGAMRGLRNRRIGGRGRSRSGEIRRLAVESYLDGWQNEARAAARLRERAGTPTTAPEARDALLAMAADEERHADLGREIVRWCFEQRPTAVANALASVDPAIDV